MSKKLVLHAALLALALITACSAPGPTTQGQAGQAPAAQKLTLDIATYAEPLTLAQKPLSSGSGTQYYSTLRAFNAALGIIDGQGVARPYLAEALPQLDTDTWRVSSEGEMDTTYRLKAGLTWHDGTPLSAEDFVFAFEVYSTPSVGISRGVPQNRIAEVTAPDPRTVLIHWKQPYPGAGVLADSDLPPLPRHILQASFDEDPASLATHPFWTRSYVGLGPYKLTQWEPGAFIVGAAFEGHSLGKPKIESIRIVFKGDANTALAALTSGDVQLATDTALKFEQGLILQEQWAPTGHGTVLISTGGFHGAFIQLRPEFSGARGLLDPRVRQALAHTLRRDDVNEALFSGKGIMTESPFIPPATSYYPDVNSVIVRYPYNVNASDQLMADAGYVKGPDGMYTSPTDGPFHPELKTLVSTERQKEVEILSAGWRTAGFDFSTSLLAAAQSADNRVRSTFPGMFSNTTGAGENALSGYTTGQMGTAQNNWIGPNRPGWSNPEFDRISAAYAGAVAPSDRIRLIGQMARVMTQDLPVIPISFDLNVDAFATSLHGPQDVAQESLVAWNIYEWELR